MYTFCIYQLQKGPPQNFFLTFTIVSPLNVNTSLRGPNSVMYLLNGNRNIEGEREGGREGGRERGREREREEERKRGGGGGGGGE